MMTQQNLFQQGEDLPLFVDALPEIKPCRRCGREGKVDVSSDGQRWRVACICGRNSQYRVPALAIWEWNEATGPVIE